jgi:chemotaxis protein CheD
MRDPISVGLGEQVISKHPDDVLVAYGLGSCLGISMFDPTSRVCGLLHAVLPVRMNGTDPLCPKYVDSGIEGLLVAMLKEGAERHRIILRMAGGANMLISPGLSNTFDIGSRNIEAAHRTLQRLGLPLKKEEVGGNTGRTVRMYVNDGRLTVRVIGGKEQEM